MAEPKPFRPRVFLFRLLAGVFIAEMVLLSASIWRCSYIRVGEPTRLSERCPKIGDRATELFTLATSTILSLLIDPHNSHD